MTKEALLLKLKEWSNKRTKEAKSKGNLLKSILSPKTNSAVVQRAQEISSLRRDAKGDTKIPPETRIYFHGEGPPNFDVTHASQILRKPVFMSKDWTNGKVLDRLADTLGVRNENNRTMETEKRLQLFHVESGTLLEMGEKFGRVVRNGDTIVIARGW
jgi:AN1-type zinc finger protein 1